MKTSSRSSERARATAPPAGQETRRGNPQFRVYTAVSIAAALKHYRQQARLTQAELAERTGLNRTYLANLEGGKETEQLRRLIRVLKELGVRITIQKADW